MKPSVCARVAEALRESRSVVCAKIGEGVTFTKAEQESVGYLRDDEM